MNNIKTTNIDPGAKTDIKAMRKPKDIHAEVDELQGILHRILNDYRHIPIESVRDSTSSISLSERP